MNRDAIKKLCFDTYVGKVQTDFSKGDPSEVIRKAFIDIIGTDKIDAKTFRRHKVDVFEIIEDVISEIVEQTWENNTFFEQFVETKNLALGDTNEFYVEDRTMLLTSKLAEGHWDIRRQRLDVGQSFPVAIETYGIAIYDEFKRFMAGRIDWGRFVQKIGESLRYKMATEVYANFMGAMTYLPPEFQVTGTFNEDALLDLVQQVELVNGTEAIIAGTKKALNNIVDNYASASFLVSENMKDELNKTGIISTFKGVRLLEIPQVHLPNSFDFMLDDSRLLVLPSNTRPIKYVTEGQTMIKEVSDGLSNQDMSIEYKLFYNAGFACVFDGLHAQYQLT